MQDEGSATTEGTGAPPYISFRTQLNLVERMADEGVPPRIDRSYLSGLSGGYQSQVMAALRWLGYIDSEGWVQPRLVELVEQPDRRPELIGALIRERYPDLVALADEKATQGQLEEEFRKAGIGGATLRKAVSFYLHAANYAGIPLSPFFKVPAAQEGRSPARGRKPRATRAKQPATNPQAQTPANGSLDGIRTRYIEMLMSKAESQDAMDEGLLDRIETLLGYERAAGTEGGPRAEA